MGKADVTTANLIDVTTYLPLLHVLSGEEEGGEVVCPAGEEFK